jgi:dTDP-4-dehydrorhamnose 3,5-epimerase
VQLIETVLPDVWLIAPRVFTDERGFFMETYSRPRLAELGIDRCFVQDNHSRSSLGVLRGLHYQLGRPQAKLVRITRGRVVDVAADVRRGSPTFGRWVMAELSEENKRMLFIPEGFAHGFLVLSEVAELQYKCSDLYAPGEERGVVWDDPGLAIDWPLDQVRARLQGRAEPEQPLPILSARDAGYPGLADMPEADLPIYQGRGSVPAPDAGARP